MATGSPNGKLLAVEHFLPLHKIEYTNRDNRLYSVCSFEKGFTLIACIIGIIIHVFVTVFILCHCLLNPVAAM